LSNSTSTTDVEKLNRVYLEHGPRSREFHDQVYRFITYLQYRYLREWDEDCQQDCMQRLLEAMDYFEPGRNLATFVFCVVRNRISTFIYNRKKHRREGSPIPLSAESDDDGLDRLCDRDEKTAALRSLQRIRLRRPEEAADLLALLDDDHPLRVLAAWKERVCRTESQERSGRLVKLRWK